MRFDEARARRDVEIVARVRAGECYADIAASVGMTANSIGSIVSAANVVDRLGSEMRARIVGLIGDGYTAAEISRRCAVHDWVVRHMISQEIVAGRFVEKASRRRRIVALRLEGRSTGAIARQLKISEKLVRAVLDDEAETDGIDARGIHPRQAEIEASVAGGETNAEIAARLGVDKDSVARVRRGHVLRKPVVPLDVPREPHPLDGAFDRWQATHGVRRAVLMPTRYVHPPSAAVVVIGGCPQIYAPMDVVAADPRRAADEKRPLPADVVLSGIAARAGSGASCALGAIAGEVV